VKLRQLYLLTVERRRYNAYTGFLTSKDRQFTIRTKLCARCEKESRLYAIKVNDSLKGSLLFTGTRKKIIRQEQVRGIKCPSQVIKPLRKMFSQPQYFVGAFRSLQESRANEPKSVLTECPSQFPSTLCKSHIYHNLAQMITAPNFEIIFI